MPLRKARNKYQHPFPTVDIIIEIQKEDGQSGVILIQRKNPPPGWALPGGFVEYGESLEEAAVREAKEETSLDIEILSQLHTYSQPQRDPRFHTISTVFVARAEGKPKARDDAQDVRIFTGEELPIPLAFDHEKILEDYFAFKKSGKIEVPGIKEKPKINPASRLKELHKVWGPAEAEVIKAFLESNGIPCLYRGRVAHSVYPLSADGMGEIKIFVAENDYEIARELLEKKESENSG